MAWEDYIPNIFAAGMPQYLPGLLGEQEAAELQNRAKVQGLLGAGLALAQGMSSAGPRRSAAQNILSALAGGVSAGQGAYQGATQNYMMQQKIAESMLERQRAQMEMEGRRKFAEMYPNLAPIAAINPTEAAKIAGEIESFKPIQEIFAGGKQQSQPAAMRQPMPPQPLEVDGVATPAPVAAPDVGIPSTENTLPGVPVEAKAIAPQVNELMRERDRLISINSQLRGVRGGNKYIEENNKSLEAIDKQLGAYTAQSFDFQTFKGMLPEQFRPMADNLESLAYSGAISPKDLNKEIADISKAANEFQQKQFDYTNEVRRVAASMFPNKQLNQLTPVELAQLDEKLQAKDVAARKAGASNVNVSVGEKKFSETLGKNIADSVQKTYDNATKANDSIATIKTIKPLIEKGVYSGPLSGAPQFIGQLATSFGFSTGSTQEKLVRTAEVMQGMAKLQLDAASAMAGQGAITDFERGLIAKAAGGDLQSFTHKELIGLLNGLEKVSRAKVSIHKKNLERLKKNKDMSELAPYYEIDEEPVKQYNQSTGRIE